MSLKHSYTVLAPAYDIVVKAATSSSRKKSLKIIDDYQDKQVLLAGIGTGLDIPHLDPSAKYTACDLTPAMLTRAKQLAQNHHLDMKFHEADVMQLPYADSQFDIVIAHLILAVVPKPENALREFLRVTRPGGKILIFDKFIRPGQPAVIRKFMNIFTRHIATRTDVVFEHLIPDNTGYEVLLDEPGLANGWFRHLLLRKH